MFSSTPRVAVLTLVILFSTGISHGAQTPDPTIEVSADDVADPSGSATHEPLPAAVAEESLQTPNTDTSQQARAGTVFDRLTVIGGQGRVDEVPGSAHYLGATTLERQDHSDIHRILRQVPGVNVQEEEGYGLRPNIGMRGTGVERSSKITLLEDGILIAPAPYTAPAAYYFPTAGRMEAMEVRKGSSSIIQGPFTTGGVLNMISTSIPYDFGGNVELFGGTDSTARVHASVGDGSARFGWLFETYQLQTDGFKELDDGGGTGVELQDYVGKVRFNTASTSRIQQAIELKIGKTLQDGDETYLGLTESDFESTPYRRYAGSQADRIDTDHEQYQLRHFIQPVANADVTTTVYRNDFFRNWYKLGSVGGVSIGDVLTDPETHQTLMSILRGEADDTSGGLSVVANRRDYYSQGVQSVAAVRFDAVGAEHDLEVGIRYHEDSEDRFQEADRWGIQNGRMFLVAEGDPGTNANRVSSAEALAFFVHDQMRFGRWTVQPGVRFENIDFVRTDYGRTDPDRTGSNTSVRRNGVDVVIPGIGVTYSMTPAWGFFGGVHKGFAPPGAGSDARTEAEESINYEAGARYETGPVRAQLVGFFNDYSNLLGRDTLSSGGTGDGDLFNGGEVDVYGLEASFSTDLGQSFSSQRQFPFRLSYTFTRAEFQTAFETSFEDWAPRVNPGDELPYLPENQWSTELGTVNEKWGTFVTLHYTDAMRTSAGQGPIPDGEGTDSYMTADLSAEYQLISKLRLRAMVRNLTDETYVVARRPAGLRPGMSRSVMLGFTWGF